MDPITRASQVFLREAASHWKRRRGPVLFMEADATSRGDLVKTLRLAEQSPSCRRPLFLFEEAFAQQEAYFSALAASLFEDYAALRQGAAEEGVSLPALSERPDLGEKRASACALAGSRAREIQRALDGKLEGMDIALVPKQLGAPAAYREAVTALAAELGRSGARLLVLSTPEGPLSKAAEGRSAHFHVDPDELADYLQNLGNAASDGPPVSPAGARPDRGAADAAGAAGGTTGTDAPAGESRELRRLLLSAAKASRQGDHTGAARLFEQARAWCAAEGRTIEEAAVLVALAGACLSAGFPDKAAASYREASALAARSNAFPLAAQASMGEGAVRMQQKQYVPAMTAYSAAAEVAERGQTAMLEVEARRMEGTAALAAGNQESALRTWKKAVEVGSGLDAKGRAATTWQDVVRALAALFRKHGMTAQAEHVEAQAAAVDATRVADRENPGRPVPTPIVVPATLMPPVPSSGQEAPPRHESCPAPPAAGEDLSARQKHGGWMTGPIELARLNLPVLPFDGKRKP